MKKSYIVSALLSATIMTMSINSASAAFEKYPGSSCQGDRSRDSANLRHGGRTLFNANTNGSTFNCNYTRTTGAGINAAYTSAVAYVFDTSAAGNISCTIFNRNLVGGLGSFTSRSSSGSSTAVQVLNFGGETTAAFGYSYLRCNFPTTVSGENVQIIDYTMQY